MTEISVLVVFPLHINVWKTYLFIIWVLTVHQNDLLFIKFPAFDICSRIIRFNGIIFQDGVCTVVASEKLARKCNVDQIVS